MSLYAFSLIDELSNTCNGDLFSYPCIYAKCICTYQSSKLNMVHGSNQNMFGGWCPQRHGSEASSYNGAEVGHLIRIARRCIKLFGGQKVRLSEPPLRPPPLWV